MYLAKMFWIKLTGWEFEVFSGMEGDLLFSYKHKKINIRHKEWLMTNDDFWNRKKDVKWNKTHPVAQEHLELNVNAKQTK